MSDESKEKVVFVRKLPWIDRWIAMPAWAGPAPNQWSLCQVLPTSPALSTLLALPDVGPRSWMRIPVANNNDVFFFFFFNLLQVSNEGDKFEVTVEVARMAVMAGNLLEGT
jgi:hypothetical protein